MEKSAGPVISYKFSHQGNKSVIRKEIINLFGCGETAFTGIKIR